MANRVDVIGSVYERLTILNDETDHVQPNGKRIRRVNCQCSCGNTKVVKLNHVKSGGVKSCGCLQEEGYQNGMSPNFKHGRTKERLYVYWGSLRKRVDKDPDIHLLEDWYDYDIFKEWSLANGYVDDNMLLYRKGGEGNYVPANVIWARKGTLKNDGTPRSSKINKYKVTTPEGKIYTITNLHEYARRYDLGITHIHMVLKGVCKDCFGHKFEYISLD